MKRIFLIVVLLFISISCAAQEKNLLTEAEFNNIFIDGVKWEDISETKGNINEMKFLFGQSITYKRGVDPDESIGFWNPNKGFYFDFEDRSGNGNYELVHFSIDNGLSNLLIKGVSISIGDNIGVLGNIKTNVSSNGTKVAIFIKENSESEGLFVKFNEGNEIIEIEYILFD